MRPLPLLTTLALLAAGAVQAADPMPPTLAKPTPAPAADQAAAPEAGVLTFPVDGLSVDATMADGLRDSLAKELGLARQQEMAEVATLTAALATAGSADEQLALQRRIVVLKSDGARRSLAIQLDYARRAGLEPLAQKIGAELAQFDALRAAPRAPLQTAAERDARPAGGAAR